MRIISPVFSHKKVDYLFDAAFEMLAGKFGKENMVIITDDNVLAAHKSLFEDYKVISFPAGEKSKQQQTVDTIILQLLELSADRNTVITGVGGGVVTDVAGYVASVFKRGVRLVQVPTSVLAMVDAAIGGKNGVDVGLYKNQVGTIYQPEVVLFDYDFLKTLPHEEWVNGFAEIIKHACIKDASMFEELQVQTLDRYKNDAGLLAGIIEKNVAIKLNVVLNDEFETGERKLLNFGHTIGHAIEAAHDLAHGQAISIGMVEAAKISNMLNGLEPAAQTSLQNLLKQYGLPVIYDYNKQKIWSLLMNDKKREKDQMGFILLDHIGKGVVKNIPLTQLEKLVEAL